jgi:hypothetical protein
MLISFATISIPSKFNELRKHIYYLYEHIYYL